MTGDQGAGRHHVHAVEDDMERSGVDADAGVGHVEGDLRPAVLAA